MTRDITSRPSWSTPNGCARLGPSGLPKALVRLGFTTFGPGRPSSLTTSGAATARNTMKAMKASDASATRSRRKRRQNICRGERAANSPAMSSELSPPTGEGSSSGPPMLMPAAPPRGRLRADLRGTRLLYIRRPQAGNLPTRRSVLAHEQYSSDGHAFRGGPWPAAGRAPAGPARARARPAARGKGQTHEPRGLRRPIPSPRRGVRAAGGDRTGKPPLDGAVRAAGLGQDDARADRGRALRGGLRGAERGAGRARGGARGDRAGRPPPRVYRSPGPRRAHGAVPR